MKRIAKNRWSGVCLVLAAGFICGGGGLAISFAPAYGMGFATAHIPPGEFFEINTRAEAGTELRWIWHTEGGELAFNMHTHEHGGYQYLIQKTTAADTGVLTADHTGGYSYMWENKTTAPIVLRYQAIGNFTIESYHPPRPLK